MAITPKKNYEVISHAKQYYTPTERKVTYQQLFKFGDKAHYRSISCGKIFSSGLDGRHFETTEVAVTNLELPIKSVKRKISFDNEDKGRMSKKKKIELKAKDLKLISILGMSVLLTLSALVASYLFHSKKSCDSRQKWDHLSMIEDFRSMVFGQDNAIRLLEATLSSILRNEKTSLLIFTGDVGVGKSFMADQILRNFPWSSQKVRTTADELPFLSFTSISSPCHWNLLIVEDCNADSYVSALEAVDVLILRAEKLRIKLLVIFIYTTHGTNDYEQFKLEANVRKHEHVPFSQLSWSGFEGCFKAEAERTHVQIHKEELDRIIREYIAEKGEAGCKQVHMKLITSLKETHEKFKP